MAQAQIGTDPHEKTRLELEQKFAKEHSKASDEELLAYLRRPSAGAWADCPKKLT